MGFKKAGVPNVIEVSFSADLYVTDVVESDKAIAAVQEGEGRSDSFIDVESIPSTEHIASVELTHVFKRPTTALRERLTDALLIMEGSRRGKSKRAMAAIFNFWRQTIIKVKGYDDLPSNGDFRPYFQDDIGYEHVLTATQLLLKSLSMEETNVEKKLG